MGTVRVCGTWSGGKGREGRIIGEGKKRVSRNGMRIQGREGRQSVGSGRVFPPLMEARRRLLGAAARAYKTDDRKKKNVQGTLFAKQIKKTLNKFYKRTAFCVRFTPRIRSHSYRRCPTYLYPTLIQPLPPPDSAPLKYSISVLYIYAQNGSNVTECKHGAAYLQFGPKGK